MSNDYQIQRTLTGSTSQVVTETGLIKSGQGVLRGLTVATTSSGTIALYDGLEAGVVATSTLTNDATPDTPAAHGKNVLTQSGNAAGSHAATVLTVSGAVNFKDAVKASAYITSNESQATAGKVVVVGDDTYTFKAAGTVASHFNVPLGATPTLTMVNLFNAIMNNAKVDAVHTSAFVITVTAKEAGTAGNSIAATTDESTLDWDGSNTTLTGGLAAETVTIQGKTYRFKDILQAENDVKIAATSALSLVNLKYAINGDVTTNGSAYNNATTAYTLVACTATDATTLTITARIPGVTPNAYVTTETCASAAWAGGTMTNGTAGVATTTATVTIDTTIYTFVTALSENIITDNTAIAFQVLYGGSVTAALLNLKKAINGTGIEGTDYSTGTTAHPLVYASASDATTVTVYSRTVGDDDYTTAVNAISFAENMANTAWASVDFGTGTGAADALVTTSGATITIGTRTYTIVKELSEASGAAAVVDQIKYTDTATMLDNIKKAINQTGIAGTDYSTGTTINIQVEATTNANTTQVINARLLGVAGNAIATSSTLAHSTWTSTVMASGTGADSKLLVGVLTPAAGSNYDFSNLEFERGLFAKVTNTIGVTVVYK